MTLITNINNQDLIQSFNRFCSLNDIYWPQGKIGGMDIETEFVKQLKRDYPQRTAEDLKTVFSQYNKGELDVRKPRKMSLNFIGQLLSASRDIGRNIHKAEPKTFEPSPLPFNLKSVLKAWEYQFSDWVGMVERKEGMPVGMVMQIDDKWCLDSGFYSVNEFTSDELSIARHQWVTANRNEKRNFLGNGITKSIKQNISSGAGDIDAIARMGAHYNRIRAMGADHYQMPDELVSYVKSIN